MSDNKIHDKFEALLDDASSKCEKKLQHFLGRHPRIITRTFSVGAQNPLVIPKYTLADDYKTDFLLIAQRSEGSLDIHLIEIEPAKGDLFTKTKKFQSTGRLRIAEGQITDWQTWINSYADFFKDKLLNYIEKRGLWDNNSFSRTRSNSYRLDLVQYYIVIGRRSDFKGRGDEYRHTMRTNSGNRKEIVSWDRLLESSLLI